jgi:hypothetical protein
MHAPEETELAKMRVAISAINYEGDKQKAIKNTKYMNQEMPFFRIDERTPSIEGLVSHSEYDSFVLCHMKDGDDGYAKRSAKNAIPGQNMIAFDVDGGVSLEDAKALFSRFTYIIYTTKSHNKEKGGIIDERFRIILPTKNIFKVTPDEHKNMLDNFAKFVNIPVYDISTRDIARLWFTNSEAEVYTNRGELIDVSSFIPKTEKLEEVQKTYAAIDETRLSDDIRISRMQKWTVINAQTGNRNNALFRLTKFLIDINAPDPRGLVLQTNAMLDEPLDEEELFRTALREFNL